MKTTMDITTEAQCKSILHWNYRGFLELPTELETNGAHIQEIYLKHNKLVKLPSWISYMRNLSALYLNNNNLSDIPREIGLLSKLTELNLSNNSLERLPSEIRSLHSLSSLIVTENNLTSLPLDFHELRALRKLDISCNGIHSLPHCIGKVLSLEELIIDGNPIFELPPSVFRLPALREFSANCCDLRCLPSLPLLASPLPSMTFKLNPALKHLPLTLEPIFETNANITAGYWTYDSTQAVHPDQIHLIVYKALHTTELDIYLYSGFKNVTPHNRMEIPPLVELCLRRTYDTYYHPCCRTTNRNSTPMEIDDPSDEGDEAQACAAYDDYTTTFTAEDLPKDLHEVLSNGPSAICQQCKVSLFSYGILTLVQRTVKRAFGENNVLCSAHFCNTVCFNKWARETHFDAENCIQWYAPEDIDE